MSKKSMTIKQGKFFEEILTSPSLAEAARRAGYSEKSCRVSANRNITRYNDFFLKFLNGNKILGVLGENIIHGLSSKDEKIRFQYTKMTLNILARPQNVGNFVVPDERLKKLSKREQADLEKLLKETGIET